MDSAQQKALVQRLVANPQDQAAIAEAHSAGQSDPQGYASLLEEVGHESTDAAMASHWLNEAANVWITTFNDLHRAATVLMAAVERCPQADAPAQRLGQLYADGGDNRALAALAERRARSVGEASKKDAALRPVAARLFEELGQLWTAAEQPDTGKAESAFLKALELNSNSQFAAYTLRELYKQRGDNARALPLYAPELAIEQDPERRLALLVDQAEVAKLAGSHQVATEALREALRLEPQDPSLRQQLGTVILERYRAASATTEAERGEAAQLFVGLAEEYPGEHGFLYSLCALELVPADDRACQLALHYGQSLGRLSEAAPMAAAYLQASPGGVMAEEARQAAGDESPPARPEPAPLEDAAPRARVQSAVGPAATSSEQISEEELADLLDEAAEYAQKSRKNQALATYKKVLASSPGNEEALSYLMQQLPAKRKYAELRDTLLLAIDAPDVADDKRIEWLKEVAGLCERQLRDFDTAVDAWRRIHELDSSQDEALDQYARLLDKARRWDDLAALLEGQAAGTEDLEVRISLERNLAKLHSSKRKDLDAAGETWGRIAGLTPGDEAALMEAVRLFEKAELPSKVADVIASNVGALDDPEAQSELYDKLGTLRAEQEDWVGAADALSEGATKLSDPAMWRQAEAHYARAEQWPDAATAALERKALAKEASDKAALAAQAARYLFQAGDTEEALARLEEAVDLAPSEEAYANELEQRLISADRVSEVATLFLGRAEKLAQPALRMELRRRAARIQRDHMHDVDAARDSYMLTLADGEDSEALAWLADDAERLQDTTGAVEYLARLAAAVEDDEQRVDILHREAELVASQLGDIDGAIERYEALLSKVDAENEQALRKIAALEEGREQFEAAAAVLERYVTVAKARETRLEVWGRLADLYQQRLASPTDAMRVLRAVHQADPDDFDATERLCELARGAEDWELVAGLMVELIAVEGDEGEVSAMTRELASIWGDKLGRSSEALVVLGKVADEGDGPCREDFVALGDSIGEKAEVARRMVLWYEGQPSSPERDDALHGAFDRFTETGHDAEAAQVAKDLAATSAAQGEIAARLEVLSVRLGDLEALAIAFRLKVGELTGLDRGDETVRQAEVLSTLDVDEATVFAHGESGLATVEPAEVEPLLVRLAKLASSDALRIDLYERQVARCRTDDERLNALCRAAEVATEADDHERASSFFEIALSAGVNAEAVERIIAVARRADDKNSDVALRTVLAEALAAGGQGARDGGKTRSYLLRRAAVLAHEELDNSEKSVQWMSDALISYVDPAGLETLLSLSAAANDYARAESVLERALGEVFDGPMVRQLLSCRAELRETHLEDKKGAAQDLKRLLDIAPGDSDVAERLGELYAEVGDFRGIVHLYEDQILRGRDKERRATLARRVAELWEAELKEPREAADAWRRVLRLTPGDEQAKEGLATAKEQMLKAKRRSQQPGADDAAPSGEGATAAESESAPAGVRAPTEESPFAVEPAQAKGAVVTEPSSDAESADAESAESEGAAESADAEGDESADAEGADAESAESADAESAGASSDAEGEEDLPASTAGQAPLVDSPVAELSPESSGPASAEPDSRDADTEPPTAPSSIDEPALSAPVSANANEPSELDVELDALEPLPADALDEPSELTRPPGPPPRRPGRTPSIAPPLPEHRTSAAPPRRLPVPPPRKG